MKKLSVLALLLVFGLAAFCAPVSLQKAQRVAEAYWSQMSGLKASFVASQTEFQEFYVFNNQNGGGFVLVSADDIAHPILGYSLDGNFRTDLENLPNVRTWFKGISKEISTSVVAGVPQSAEIAEEWNSILNGIISPKRETRAVNALLSTTWDQGKPYNNLCPADNNTSTYYYGGRTVTGCVATAMAQVMKFWNYPTQGNGSHSYSSSYGTLSANFGNTTYDWENMPNNLTNSSSSDQKTAVATLMYHCGVAVEMGYDIAENGGSGAYSISYNGYFQYCAERALVQFFKYKSTIEGYLRANYQNNNETAWKNKIKSDLDAGRPIIYSGASDEGGHCFVCDGYNTNDRYHFNWGWSGDNDGFYALNALTPGSGGAGGGGYDFSEDQDAIFGIQPQGMTVNPTSLQLLSSGESKTFSVTSSTASNSQWHATLSTGASSWLTVSPTSGNGNGATTTVTVTASANNSGAQRNATITLTQGSETATVTVTQPDGAASIDGWYGNTSEHNDYNAFTATHEIIIRPEQFGTFEAGNKVMKIRFATYRPTSGTEASYNNNSFTIRIYENCPITSTLASSGYDMISNVLNTPVYTQNYTQVPGSGTIVENIVDLTTPYQLNGNNFWISVVANGPTLFLDNLEAIGSPAAAGSFQSDPSQGNNKYLYTETYTQNGTNYELINTNYATYYTDNTHANVQAYNVNYELAFYLSRTGTYTETVDFQAELFGGVSGGYLQEAPASYTLGANEDLVIYPFFWNAGPDAASSGTIEVAVKLNGTTVTSINDDASSIEVNQYYCLASSPYSVTITAAQMNDLNLTGNFNVCVEINYSGTDADLSNNSHCIPVTRSSSPSYSLTVNPTSLSYTAAGESKTVTVTSNTTWNATSSASWLTISPASGSNNGTITAVASANTTTSQRTATITVSGNGVSSQTISVTQAGTTSGGDEGDCIVLHEDRFISGGTVFSVQNDGGYVCGSNSYHDQAKAEYFELSGAYNITSVDYAYAIDGTNGNVTFKIWADNNGTPGNELASQLVSLSTLNSAATNNNGTMMGQYTWTLSSPVAVTGNFFAGIDVSSATSYFGLVSTNSGSGYTDSYEQYNGSWSDIYTNWQGLDISMYILPTACPTGTVSYNLSVNPSTLSYTANGESKTVTVTSNTTWTATSSASWLTISPASGSNNGTFTATAAANTSTTQRTATITVTGNGATTQTISVTQVGNTSYTLTVNPTSLSYTANGESKTVSISSNTTWNATSSASWLTISPASGSNNGTITAVAAANISTEPRSATITVTGANVATQTITVTQAGAPTSIEEETIAGISVYPNPTNGSFAINFSAIEGNVTYQLINAKGSIVETREINASDNTQMSFDYNIAAGVYFVRIISNGNTWTERIIVE